MTHIDLGDNSEIDFTFDPEADLYQSCAIEFQNNFYIIGGLNRKTQVLPNNNYRKSLEYFCTEFKINIKVSKVNKKSCKLERKTNMDFEFHRGSCGKFNHETEFILLCFPHQSTHEYNQCIT